MRTKILYNDPSGEQRLESFGKNGSVSDEMVVLWDERVDGTIPDKAVPLVGGLVRSGKNLEFSQAQQDTHDTAIASRNAQLYADVKNLAHNLVTDNSPMAITIRAILTLVLDELNDLRTELRGLKSRGSAATNTQASIRGIFTPMDALPNRNKGNLKTGFQAKVTADIGNLD